jgi:hypothetical protein
MPLLTSLHTAVDSVGQIPLQNKKPAGCKHHKPSHVSLHAHYRYKSEYIETLNTAE